MFNIVLLFPTLRFYKKQCPIVNFDVITHIVHTGGWGLLNGSSTSNWNINSDSFLLDKSLGSPAFFTIDITIDDKNSSQYILEVCTLVAVDVLVMSRCTFCFTINRCLSVASLSLVVTATSTTEQLPVYVCILNTTIIPLP